MGDTSKMSSHSPIGFGKEYDPVKMQKLEAAIARSYASLRRLEAMLIEGTPGQVLTKSSVKDFLASWENRVSSDEVATAQNVGDGAGIFSEKDGTVFKFKSLVAGDNVTVTETEETIEIAAADPSGGGGGDVDAVVGGAGVDVDATDPVNPVVNLNSATIASLGLADTAVQPARAINSGTGLTGGGSLAADRTLALDAASIASLALADTAVQPARNLTTGTGLTGGGNLSADRTFALNSTSIASLALADTSVQPARSISAGTGLSGGGNLSADRTVSLSASSISSLALADSAVQPAGLSSAIGGLSVVYQPLSSRLTAWAAGDVPSAFTVGIVDAVDAAAWRAAIGAGTSTVTPAALTKTDDTNVTLTLGGTPATSLLQATSITVAWSGTLAKDRGGFGLDASSLTGYVKAAGAGAMTASATIPYSDLTGAPTLPTSSTYTPTLSNVASIGGTPTAYLCQYMRVGDAVMVSGRVSAYTTGFPAVLGISLPVASDFAAMENAGGTGCALTTAFTPVSLYADASANLVYMQINATIPSPVDIPFFFMYRVI